MTNTMGIRRARCPQAGLEGPSRTIKVDPVRRTAPAPEPQRHEPVKEPVGPAREREKEKVGS